MEGELLQLFPTPVGRFKFRSLTDDEHGVIMFYCKDVLKNSGNFTTCSKNVLDDHNLRFLKSDITDYINEYYQMVYQHRYTSSLYITLSWCNINYTGDNHHLHNHSNSIISGTYYIEADSTDSISFVRDKKDNLPLTISPHTINPFNHGEYTCPVDKNVLVLFPSTLFHQVRPLDRPGARISLAFNTFGRGVFGDENNLTLLNL